MNRLRMPFPELMSFKGQNNLTLPGISRERIFLLVVEALISPLASPRALYFLASQNRIAEGTSIILGKK